MYCTVLIHRIGSVDGQARIVEVFAYRINAQAPKDLLEVRAYVDETALQWKKH